MEQQADHDGQPKLPVHPEQDLAPGSGDLPTYDDLTAQHANQPNSRFGRWRSWIGKRAAERYADTSHDEWSRRRARGWELEEEPSIVVDEPTSPTPDEQGAPSFPHPNLRVLTDFSDAPPPVPPKDRVGLSWSDDDSATLPPGYSEQTARPSLIAARVAPSHLRLNHFGSRFIPHATSPIRCMLPVPSESLLLLGTDDGLSVLNLFPSEWTDEGLTQHGPSDAYARVIWIGEGVLQMSLLELESATERGPDGVVLALVGGDPLSPREGDGGRVIRMYNLASLISLAKWAMSDRMLSPLDLRRPSGWQQQETPTKKKHGRGPSLAKGLKALIIDSPVERATLPFSSWRDPPSQQASRNVSPARADEKVTTSSYAARAITGRTESSESTASWDVVDDLPLRWATNYVALSAPGSRLTNVSVHEFSLHINDDRRTRGGAMLAVVTKSNILLYETPKGERAFRFVKDFYTPLAARHVTFVQQTVSAQAERIIPDLSRSPRTSSHMRSPSSQSIIETTYPPQLTLFVVFEKKAGLIRISDSAVGELELYSNWDAESLSSREPSVRLGPSLSTSSSVTFGRRRRANSADGSSRGKESKGSWTLPIRIDLPPEPSASDFTLPTPGVPGSTPVYILTRGRTTHIVPCPLPAAVNARPPLHSFSWAMPPTHVTPRINHTSYELGAAPFLQLVAFGEDGVEVQELPLSGLVYPGGGKGKSRAEEPVYAAGDVGGEAGFLCTGGHWQRAPNPNLGRTFSVASDRSGTSFDSLSSEQADAKLSMEQGVYGWVRKGLEDYRVFWLGGTGKEDVASDEEEDVYG